jgi:hypothetical protein
LSGAFDDDLTADQGVTRTSGDTRVSGQYSVADAVVSLARRRQRLSVFLTGSSSMQRYQDADRFVGSNGSGSAVISANLGRKTLFRTSLDATRLSTFSVEALMRPTAQEQAEAVPAEGLSKSGLPLTKVDWTLTTAGGTAELIRTISRRAAIGFIGGARRNERRTLDLNGDEQNVGVQLWRETGRASSMRLAYLYQQVSQRTTGDTRETYTHDFVVGFERRWMHSATRRTTLAVSGGPALQRQAVVAVTPDADEPAHLFRVVGSVTLNHAISDAWSARMSYRRGTGVANALVFSNTATVDVHGSWTRRLDIQGSLGYTDGDLGVASLRGRYVTSYGSARVQYALARSIAVYAQSFLYRYDFGDSRTAPVVALNVDDAVSPVEAGGSLLDRRGVRVGVNVWVPLK